MRRMSRWCAVFSIVAVSCCGFAQELDKKHGKEKEKPGKIEHEEEGEVTAGTVMLGTIMHLQRTFLPMAMAMPGDKYGYAPTDGEFKGVRTFGQQVKHVAATNYIYASAIAGEKPPADVGEDGEGPASLKTKEEILKYVTDSFYYVQKAVVKVNEKNIVSPIKNPFGEGQATRLSMSILIVGHCNDHYGQLDLRLNGIVPPASQR
jgi:hypothetical protein